MRPQPAAYILDSFAILAYLEDEPGAQKVEELLEQREIPLYVCTISLGEVLYLLLREEEETVAQQDLAKIQQSAILQIDTDWPLIEQAAKIKAGGGLSFADCFVVATAQRVHGVVVTGDPEFQKPEGQGLVQVLWLPAPDFQVQVTAGQKDPEKTASTS
jgi:predicted nucleic acid-binding protein